MESVVVDQWNVMGIFINLWFVDCGLYSAGYCTFYCMYMIRKQTVGVILFHYEITQKYIFIRTCTFARNIWDFLQHATENVSICCPCYHKPLKWFSYQLYIPLYNRTSSNYTWSCSGFFFFVTLSLWLLLAFMKKLRVDWILGMITNTQFRILCQLFFMGVKLGLSYWGHNIDWHNWRTGS